MTEFLHRLLYRVAVPLLAIGAGMLHIYTTITVTTFVESMSERLTVAILTWITPPISEFVVAYYAWRATRSMVNSYSVWLLAWLVGFIGVLCLVWILRRLKGSRRTGEVGASD